MMRTEVGGLTYPLGKLLAGFLSFLLGPAMGGAVFGFFHGMLVGLLEDLCIFLQMWDMFKAIAQLPKMQVNPATPSASLAGTVRPAIATVPDGLPLVTMTQT